MFRSGWPLLLGGVIPMTLFVAACANMPQQHHADESHLPTHAVCVLVPSEGSMVAGVLTLVQQTDGVLVSGEVSGLSPGDHGFHIHEFGDLRSADGTAAGGHFNPDGHEHGGLESEHRHAGDLGNITADDQGVARVNVLAPGLKLHFAVGRSLVVHADPDDLTSQPSGNSGPRIGVGVIGIASGN